jgi:MFS family permease
VAEAAPSATIPNVRWNFTLNVLDGAFYSFGLSFASATTVLPVFVQRLGGSDVAVGMIPVVWAVGLNLPQLLIANHAQQVRSKKRLLLTTALIQRLPWLLLAAGTFLFVGGASPTVGLGLFFTAFALAALGGSLNMPVWFDFVAKVTPVKVRGRLFAVRAVVGSVLGIVGGLGVTWVLGAVAYPLNFALLFSLAFAAMMISYVALVLLREGEQAVPRRRIEYGLFLRLLPRILRRNRNYRNFLIGDALFVTASVAGAFFTVDAIGRFGLPESYAGRFTIVMAAASVVAGPLFGVLGDRFGHRLNLFLGAVATVLASVLALIAPSVEVYLLVFVCSASVLVLRSVSRLPIVAELCAEADRPTYVALSNVLTAPFALAGVLAGWVAGRFGYDAVFVGTAVVGVVAAYWMLERVREPRAETGPPPSLLQSASE